MALLHEEEEQKIKGIESIQLLKPHKAHATCEFGVVMWNDDCVVLLYFISSFAKRIYMDICKFITPCLMEAVHVHVVRWLYHTFNFKY